MPSLRYGPSGRPICPQHRVDTCPTLSEIAQAAGIEEYISFLETLKRELPHFIPHGCNKIPNAFLLYRSKYRHELATEVDQRDISKAAGDIWEGMSDAKKETYIYWYEQLKKIECALCPGLPAGGPGAASKKRKATSRLPKLAPSSTSTTHPYLPSPPISDGDNEYSPRRSSSSRRNAPSRRTIPARLTSQLLTPMSETEELQPAEDSEPMSPTLVPNSPLLPRTPPSPILNLTLNELNLPPPDTCLSPLLRSPCHRADSYDQPPMGYAAEEHHNPTIIDWNRPSILYYGHYPTNMLQFDSTEGTVDHVHPDFDAGGL